jgi:uncharacterized protein YbbC (DUF1343 family)
VASERGKTPIISLYGDRRRPTREELAQVDRFVVDLQDVGSRYYTYAATMRECLAACLEAGTPMVILDRPNPAGGAILEGPIAVETSSAVCCAAIPVRHGMTLGELAQWFLKGLAPKPRPDALTICELDGWTRERLFAECALPWIAPSPNMPTPETALLYAGTCLFEGTNLNEGRGTDTPFHVIGAPWLDARAVIHDLTRDDAPGCSLHAIHYTPVAIPGKAATPRYRDEPCQGIRIVVERAADVRAFTLAVALLRAIRKRHGTKFAWLDLFDVLAGGPQLRQQIEAGRTAQEIVAAYAPALAAFDKERPRRYETLASFAGGPQGR